ncbi:MAG: HhH-GPD-type base excision DNA repair protein [Nitriliruptorales bacterium]
MGTGTFWITGDEEADKLLAEDPLALLIGMLLDQQVPMEWAFVGPYRLKERLGGSLDAAKIGAMDDEEIEGYFKQKPSLHRFPGSMAKRARDLCAYLVEHYDGDAAAVWETAEDGATALERLKDLPGFGDEKSRIFLAVLGKRLGVAPQGWEEAAAPFSDETPRSVADIDSPELLEEVRAWKKQRKGKKT